MCAVDHAAMVGREFGDSNMPDASLSAAIRRYPGGVVLACYGSGTMPHGAEVIEAIRMATRRSSPRSPR